MATYAFSDLHGEYKLFKQIQEYIQKDDVVYCLGDCCDRGPDGIKIIQEVLKDKRFIYLLGNHEAMLLSCSFLFEEITEESISELDEEKMSLLDTYTESGGEVTLKALRKLDRETVTDILDYLRDCPLYDTLTVNGRDFILVDGGLDEFDKNKKLTEYTPDEFLWAWPEYDDEYFEDITTVFGHTPTLFYGKEFKGKILHRPTWIDVDIGSVYGNGTAMLRLDDMKEFYI